MSLNNIQNATQLATHELLKQGKSPELMNERGPVATKTPKSRIATGGSLQNRMAEVAKMPEPEVGMGATILSYTDRRAATIVSVDQWRGVARRIGVVEDDAKRILAPGEQAMSDSQRYEYSPGSGCPTYFTRRNTGQWVRVGESTRMGQVIALGHRDSYHDFSF